jgi:chromate transporter
MASRKPTPALLWQIFITFLKIGPVTFGGGYAMIPLIEREVVDKRRWVETKDIADIFAVAQSVPGAVAINSAAFAGLRVAGVAGAIAAMTGILLPTFCIVVLLSLFFLQVRNIPVVEAAFVSIRPTIVALITYAAYKIGRTAIIDRTTAVIVAATVLLMILLPIHPVLIIVAGALAGIAIVRLRQAMGIQTKLGIQTEPEKQKKSQTTHWDPEYFMGDGI